MVDAQPPPLRSRRPLRCVPMHTSRCVILGTSALGPPPPCAVDGML